VGAVLTSLGGVLGVVLSSALQGRAWVRQYDAQRLDEELAQTRKTFEDISSFLDRRLYRMRRLYWAARQRATGAADGQDFPSAWSAYREIVTEWNDNLNRVLALAEVRFGAQVRGTLEAQVYEFAVLGRGLEEIVRMVSAADGAAIDVPRFEHRLDALGTRVYLLNVRLLGLLRGEQADQADPHELVAAAAGTSGRPALEIGDRGSAVSRLQRALRRGGQQIAVDGRFGRQTWLAVRSAQQANGLNVDGIAGPRTWAALPPGDSMPTLRLGSTGPVVAALQKVLTQHAETRWATAPEAETGVFDRATSAAVQDFQRWNAIRIDGQVGDQTWAAPIGDAATSLEDAVGLRHIGGI
jgi:hypothetical protein